MKSVCWVDALKLKLTLPSLYWCAGYSWRVWANGLHGVCIQHGHKSSVVLLGRILSCAPYCSFSWIYHKLQILFIYLFLDKKKSAVLLFFFFQIHRLCIKLYRVYLKLGEKSSAVLGPWIDLAVWLADRRYFSLSRHFTYLIIQVSPSLPGLTHSPASQSQHVPLAKGTLLLILLLSFDVSYCEPRIWTLWYTQEWGRYSGKNLRKT